MRHIRFTSLGLAMLTLAVVAYPATAKEPAKDTGHPIALKTGEEVPVDLKRLRDALSSLDQADRAELVRDALLSVAYVAFPSDPEQRMAFAASHGALRRPYLGGLAGGDVGRGRYASLTRDEGVLLVPTGRDGEGRPFDVAVACRLLDKHLCLGGKLPGALHIVVYRVDRPASETPAATLTLQPKVETSDFYKDGGPYGYVRSTIKGVDDLEKFLKATDDLVAADIEGGKKLVVAGRKYPDGTFRAKGLDRTTLDDLRVLWAAFHDTEKLEDAIKARLKARLKDEKVPVKLMDLLAKRQLEEFTEHGSELGFSLDPWYEVKKLNSLLDRAVKNERLMAGVSEKYRQRLRDCVEKIRTLMAEMEGEIGDKKAVPILEVPASEQEDRSGLFTLKAEVIAESLAKPEDRQLRPFADFLELLLWDAQFVRARYDGVMPGTHVVMTMYYCDLIAKAYAFGQIGGKPIANLPRVEGLDPWPKIRLGGQFWEQVQNARHLRLWWGADTNGFRWQKTESGSQHIIFGPVAVRISFRSKSGEVAREEDPDPLRARFRDQWNDHYLDLADQDCVFHHFNQIYKWSIVIKWLKDFGDPKVLEMVAGKPAKTDLRFDKWYADASAKDKVPFRVNFDFSKRIPGVPEETMGFVFSGKYLEAGTFTSWGGGGDSGPSRAEIRSAERKELPKLGACPGIPIQVRP